MSHFQPPPFRQHLLFRGGHLQTIASVRAVSGIELPTTQHVVDVSGGDSIVVHDDCPVDWKPGDSSIVLFHGLCGCHGSPYMMRLADAFFRRGVRAFRVDMRGCGAASELAAQLTHAGRSEDVIQAIGFVANLTKDGKLGATGVSLGGNQLLRAVGRIGSGAEATPEWMNRLERVAVVAPPIDLKRCSSNMERAILRPYNAYFIRILLSRAPKRVREREDFQEIVRRSKPRTLRELDDWFTAPLSGFADAAEYYDFASAKHVAAETKVPVLVLTSADDPMVPIACFTDGEVAWPDSTQLVVSPKGGHVGFIGRGRQYWMDQVMLEWFKQF